MLSALLVGACASNSSVTDTAGSASIPSTGRGEFSPLVARRDELLLISAERTDATCEPLGVALTTPISEPVRIVGRISYDEEPATVAEYPAKPAKSQWAKKAKAVGTIWGDIRQGLRFKRPSRKAIDAEIKWIVERKEYLRRALVASTPYLHFVVTEIKRRGLPTELALLPIIESGFNPKALSPTGALGLWQFMPSTAEALGMHQSAWYDARGDVVASTQTALTYLANLNNRFGGNWALTLAAYNAGAAKVWRAMRQNRRKGEPEDYWSLPLPAETNRYVPRLLAIAEIISDPAKYKFRLPRIENTPHFEVATFEHSVDLPRLAELGGADYDELAMLNPGFKHTTTDPRGPRYLLLPKRGAKKLKNALASGKAEAVNVVMTSYVVKPGDSLGGIAQRHGVTISALKSINQLRSSNIRSGSKLLIPVAGSQKGNAQISQAPQAQDVDRMVHTVKSDENLSTIARRYGVTYIELAQWNDLSNDEPLRPGQRIEIKHTPSIPKTGGRSI